MPLTPVRFVAATSPRDRRERGGLVLAMVLLALLVVASRWESYRQLDEGERASLQSQVRAIGDSLQRHLSAVRSALNDVRDDIAKLPPAERRRHLELRLPALVDAMPGVRSMHVVDAQGRVWASSAPALVGAAFPVREVLRGVAGQPQTDRLYLSEPFVAANGQRTLALSMALPGDAGDDGGIVVAPLEADHLRTLIAATLYAGDMSGLVLHGGSGAVVLQHPEPAVGEESAAQLDPGSPISRHLRSAEAAQVLVAALPGSAGQPGPRRLVALRNVQPPELQMDWPLLLALSRDQSMVFAAWRTDSAIAAALLLVAFSGAWIAVLNLQRRRAQMEDLGARTSARQAADSERLALALRGGDLALWDAQLPGGHSVVNERWYTMLGLDPAAYDGSGSEWITLIHPDDRQRVLAAQQAHLDGQTPAYEVTYRLRHAQGHWVWVLDRGRVVERDAQGRASRMVGTHMDISERVRAEDALRDSEAQLAELTAALPGPVARLDREGRYLFTNPACDRWFGRTHEQVHGRSWREVYPPEVRAVVDPQMALALAGQTRTFDVALPTVTGPRDSIISLVPDRDVSGAVRGCFAVVTDISERKRAEEALRDSQDQLRMASRLARVGSWRQDLTSGEVVLHEELCEMLGVGADYAMAAGEFFRFVAPDSQDLMRVRAEQCKQAGVPFDIEVNAVSDRGRPLRLRVLGEPVHDAAGRIVAVQGAMQDMTEAHVAAQHLQRLENERIALERQLGDAQKMESIGTLAGGIAHDFNNILPAILGNVALARADLRDLPPENTALRCLDQINAAALRARSLVQQILTFSRRQSTALQPQPLRPVVEETLALLRATLPATVRLDTALAEETLVVEADATQLQQVLMNLCTNAWHALPEGRGSIEVGLQALDAEAAAAPALNGLPAGPAVHLWVRDDGSGMDEATLQRIFDPFFTTKAIGQGTGLGLSVAHGIVRAHRGAITVDSRPGAGSTFHVYLPRQALPEAPPAETSVLPETAPGQGQRLLYVDDDEVMGVLVQRLLERAGYEVQACTTGGDALARVRAAPQGFELVITDFNMPEMSGLDLARALSGLRPDLPVIISSGYLTDRLRSDAKAAGVRALLRKENTLEKLPALVQQVLHRAALEASR